MRGKGKAGFREEKMSFSEVDKILTHLVDRSGSNMAINAALH
jgi:hypothetical protein